MRCLVPSLLRSDWLELEVEFFQQFFHGQTVMSSDAFEDAGEGSRLDRMMMGNHFMVFPSLLSGDADMGTFLSIHRVTQYTEGLDELWAVDIAWYFYRARTSSRTKWSRIIWGTSIVSSK